MRLRRTSALLGMALLCGSADAALVRVEIEKRATVSGGRYERISGRAWFAADPKLAANRIVTDIGLCPVNGRGEVEFSADFYVLRPADRQTANGTLLLEISNRGGRAMLRFFDFAEASTDPSSDAEFGDRFLLEQGYTLAWVGWQFDLPEEPELLRLYTPAAKGVRGLVRSEFVPDRRETRFSLGDRTMKPYPVASDAGVTLTVRDRVDGPRRVLPRDSWKVENGTHVLGDFEPGRIYELVYTAADPPVAGLGPAAVRDFVSYAKYGDAEMLPRVRRAIGFGISQSGRFLRKFLYDGFNADEKGRRVFDGVMAHVAGAGRGSFNHRFAQPSRDGHPFFNTLYPTDLYPFTDDALLARAEKAGVVPKMFLTNSSYEYYGRAASLIHTTPDGGRDVAPRPTTRIYLIAGTQHGPAPFPPPKPNGTQHLTNPNDLRWAMRALLAAMQDWLAAGKEPPPSRYPRIADDNLVPLAALRFPKLPGVALPVRIQRAWRVDYGPDFETRGIVTIEPPRLGAPYTVLVPQADSDGNEIAGIRLPEIAVPLATYTGWNLRDPSIGAAEELYSMAGSWLPFPAEKVKARYAGREDYLDKIRVAARELVAQRYLLPRDIPQIVARAAAEWDYLERRAAAQ